MILISHRGNINGRNVELENHPSYITRAVELGYNVEIDVWFKDNAFFLGHDEPQYSINLSFLRNKNLWCHAKNLQALDAMLKESIHCFWHQNDDYTITSKGIIWVYPGKLLNSNSICVMPELSYDISTMKFNCAGICSDVIERFNETQ